MWFNCMFKRKSKRDIFVSATKVFLNFHMYILKNLTIASLYNVNSKSVTIR